MRNKGLFLFFSIVIAITCLYCLSFSFVSWRISKEANRFANDHAVIEEALLNITDPMRANQVKDSIVSARRAQFLADKNDERVFLGFTFRQVRQKEINLGLDLRGGMSVTLEVSLPDVLKSLAENTDDPLFTNAFEKANAEFTQTGGDYIDIFVRNFNAEKIAMNMPNAQLRTYFGERSGIKGATDADIIKF